jgi:hypothetical protein
VLGSTSVMLAISSRGIRISAPLTVLMISTVDSYTARLVATERYLPPG